MRREIPLVKIDADRFFNSIDVTGGCWLWTGAIDSSGYGVFAVGDARYKAHVVAWVLETGEQIPEGMDPDHLCHTQDELCVGGVTDVHRRCVRPDHIEIVTHAENVRRSNAGRLQRERTHCPRGHGLVGANLIPSQLVKGKRSCRACDNAAAKARRRCVKTGMEMSYPIVQQWVKAVADDLYEEYMAEAADRV